MSYDGEFIVLIFINLRSINGHDLFYLEEMHSHQFNYSPKHLGTQLATSALTLNVHHLSN